MSIKKSLDLNFPNSPKGSPAHLGCNQKLITDLNNHVSCIKYHILGQIVGLSSTVLSVLTDSQEINYI